MDGFFVAKLRKFANGVKAVQNVSTVEEETKSRDEFRDKKHKANLKKKEKRKAKKANYEENNKVETKSEKPAEIV